MIPKVCGPEGNAGFRYQDSNTRRVVGSGIVGSKFEGLGFRV